MDLKESVKMGSEKIVRPENVVNNRVEFSNSALGTHKEKDGSVISGVTLPTALGGQNQREKQAWVERPEIDAPTAVPSHVILDGDPEMGDDSRLNMGDPAMSPGPPIVQVISDPAQLSTASAPPALPKTSDQSTTETVKVSQSARTDTVSRLDSTGLDDDIGSPEIQNPIMERSPGGRYVRFREKLGSGASKDVYRAYDTQEGIEVAWNVVNLSGVPKNERNRIVNEVRLLERLHHHNIISFHGSWVNRERQEVNFVTEILSSGTLKKFINKVQVIRWKIAKRWAVQILKGLEYLHSQDPPVIHRDLKCDNIFINGTSGDLRIGDLGLSTVHRNGRVLSVLGTPEFMAPDMYEDRPYDEKVDIYAFGMCLLEIFTKEIPYAECNNPAQIYKKVSSGEVPEILSRLESKHARDFILLCLGFKNEEGIYVRPTASELLVHPFLVKRANDDDEVMVDPPLREKIISEESGTQNHSGDKLNSVDKENPRSGLPPRAPRPVREPDYDGDKFEEMPESETNMKRVKVLMGRDTELEEEDTPPKMTSVPPIRTSESEGGESTVLAGAAATVHQSEESFVQVSPVPSPSETGERPSDGAHQQQQKVEPMDSLTYLVASAVIEEEVGRPYADEVLKLVVTLPIDGQTQNVQFDFHLVEDDPVEVAREMVQELSIPQGAILEISGTISGLARAARMKQDKYASRHSAAQNQAQGQTVLPGSIAPQPSQVPVPVTQPQQGVQASIPPPLTSPPQQQNVPQYSGDVSLPPAPAFQGHASVNAPVQQPLVQTTNGVHHSQVSVADPSSAMRPQQVNHLPVQAPVHSSQSDMGPQGQTRTMPQHMYLQQQSKVGPSQSLSGAEVTRTEGLRPSHSQGALQQQQQQSVHQPPQSLEVHLMAASHGSLPDQSTVTNHVRAHTSGNGSLGHSPTQQLNEIPVSASVQRSQGQVRQTQGQVSLPPPQGVLVSNEGERAASQPPLANLPKKPLSAGDRDQSGSHSLLLSLPNRTDANSKEVINSDGTRAVVEERTKVHARALSDTTQSVEVEPRLGDDDEDDDELRQLYEEFQKNIQRARKVYDNRMDSLQRCQIEREAQHKKTLEKHQKDRVEFEKRLAQEAEQQNKRIEQMQREWDKQRELARTKKKAAPPKQVNGVHHHVGDGSTSGDQRENPITRTISNSSSNQSPPDAPDSLVHSIETGETER